MQVQLLGLVVYHGKQSKQRCYLRNKVTVIMGRKMFKLSVTSLVLQYVQVL